MADAVRRACELSQSSTPLCAILSSPLIPPLPLALSTKHTLTDLRLLRVTQKNTEDGHTNSIMQAHFNSHSISTASTNGTSTKSNMPAHQEWVENNDRYAAAFGEKSALPLAPGKKLAIGEFTAAYEKR